MANRPRRASKPKAAASVASRASSCARCISTSRFKARTETTALKLAPPFPGRSARKLERRKLGRGCVGGRVGSVDGALLRTSEQMPSGTSGASCASRATRVGAVEVTLPWELQDVAPREVAVAVPCGHVV